MDEPAAKSAAHLATPAMAFNTRCVHGGDARNPSGHVSPPICLSTAFVLPDPEIGARRAADVSSDEFYGRWGSRNAREFESLIASLEEADEAVAAASGLAIIGTIAQTFLRHGDHCIASYDSYAEVRILLQDLAERGGIEITFVRSTDTQNFANALRPNTRLIFTETPANPTLNLVDIQALANLSRAAGCLLVVDSTFASPVNQQPLAWGADIVVHSATKYLGGHSDAVAGVCAGSAALMAQVRHSFSFHGPHLDPFTAWLLCRGVRTLHLRVRQQNANALHLARFLEAHAAVAQVMYPGLSSHPQYRLAQQQMRGGGGMVCFSLKGGRDAALALLDNLRLIKMAVSLGGVSSTLTHPGSMTHNLLSPAERALAGIDEGLLRFSVGIEEAVDLERDLAQGLNGR